MLRRLENFFRFRFWFHGSQDFAMRWATAGSRKCFWWEKTVCPRLLYGCEHMCRSFHTWVSVFLFLSLALSLSPFLFHSIFRYVVDFLGPLLEPFFPFTFWPASSFTRQKVKNQKKNSRRSRNPDVRVLCFKCGLQCSIVCLTSWHAHLCINLLRTKQKIK